MNILDFADKKCNFHSHTARCRHAVGEDRDYVEAAIRAGYQVMGFSDHAPYFFPEGYASRIRMSIEEYPGYVESVLKLKEEYKGVIDIKLGLETEYFPDYFDELMEKVGQYPIDYMILGHHFLDDEPHQQYVGHKTDEESFIARYTEQVLAGLDTGRFLYVAHPDIINYTGDVKIRNQYFRILLDELKRRDMPVEVNVNGHREKDWYPNEDFVRMAAENGNSFILGVDAHAPGDYQDLEHFESCRQMVLRHGGEILCL